MYVSIQGRHPHQMKREYYNRKICVHFVIDFKDYFVYDVIMAVWAINRHLGETMIYEENDGVTCDITRIHPAHVPVVKTRQIHNVDNPMDVWRMGVMAVSIGIWRHMEMTMSNGVTHVVKVGDRGNEMITETIPNHGTTRVQHWTYGDAFPWSVDDIPIP